MAKRQPAEPPAEQPKAGWSLGLPEEDAADAAPTDDVADDTTQPHAATGEAETAEDELAPEREERDEPEEGSGPPESDAA